MLRTFAFRNQLGIIFSVGILLLALTSTLVTSGLIGRNLKGRLVTEGLKLTENFAEQSAAALLLQNDDHAAEVAAAFLSFPDVQSVEILAPDRRRVYALGPQLDGPDAVARWSESVAISGETPAAWQFVSPVYPGHDTDRGAAFDDGRRGEVIGYVRLAMGKDTLNTMASGIFRYNLLVSMGLAVPLLLVLLMITGRIMRPLRDLAGIMRRAEAGEKGVRARLQGASDIRDMESAFNTMMNVLGGREEALKQARDRALESARAKAEFAANVSHELRTPMNGVLGMLDLLADAADERKRRDYIDVARSSAQSLLTLIDELLSFAKNEAGKSNLELREFRLEQKLEEIIALLGPQAQAKGLDFAYVTAPGLPSAYVGDVERIGQVLLNLCGNAIRFTRQGYVAIEVAATEVSAGRCMLRFAVGDTGTGIGREQQSRIFEAFSQADESTTREFGGTGLGLAISRQLVHLMGGEIGVDSQLGCGSRFWFSIPLLRAAGGVEQLATPRLKQRPLRVLVVDNCDLVRRGVGCLCDRYDTPHDVAGSWNEAVHKLQVAAQGVPFNVLLVDECLDGGRGIELAEQARCHPSYASLHCLVMSRHTAGPAGAKWGRVAKPVQHDALLAAINRCLEGADQPAGAVPAPAAPDPTQQLFEGCRVLVVEDDRANQLVVVAMLETMGCSADVVPNGRECLEQIARDSYDLVLMDCHMPELDGYRTTAIIRDFEADNSHLPVIAMTANVREGEAQKCLAAGMDDFLAKPLSRDGLRQKLRRWLPLDEPIALSTVDSGACWRTGELPLPATQAANDSPVVSLPVLQTLYGQLGSALDAILEAVAEDLPGYLAELAAALQRQDAARAADIAHTVKGSACNIGATRLVEASARLERHAREGAVAPEHLHAVLTAAEAVLSLLAGDELRRQLAAAAPSVTAPVLDERQPGGGQAHILIVDDDRGSRLAMAEVLRREGYRVDEAGDGAQALSFCQQQTPDLILMDAVMPQLDGFTACARLQERPLSGSVPVLIITALDDEASISKAFACGAIDYIAKPVNFWVLSRRINHLVQARHAQRHVHRLAYNDTLTGLPNRVMFNERIREAMGRSRGSSSALAVLFLDLDRFKLVNDTLGHETGDLLLKYFSERVQRCLRRGDMVARFGGDEFTILLERVKSRETVCQVAEKIHEQLSRPFVFMGREMFVSTSIGVALYPDHGEDIGTLLKHADMAMYRAKKLGESYRFYEGQMALDAGRRLQLESDLRGALDRGEFEIFYQPQEHLGSGEVAAVEALLRWRHPERGLIGPEEFIDLAEETAQIVPLGEWVLRQVCAQLQSWRAQWRCGFRVAVNLSCKELVQPDLASLIGRILTESGLPAGCLELEITESIIMSDAEQVMATLVQLKAMGLGLAIDDFGTGYSALNYLRRLPVDAIKIDRSFIVDIIGNQVDADIVKTIIDLAHALGIRVVAEGVETELQKVFLKKQGCDLAQGYYLSRPVLGGGIESRFLSRAQLAGGLVPGGDRAG